MPKLTKRLVESIESDRRDRVVWDDELRGFGLRVRPSGIRTYVIQYRNAAGREKRLTVGRHGILTPEEARRYARTLLGDVARGDDPAAKRQGKRISSTISELAARFLREHSEPKKRPSSIATDRRLLEKCILPTLGRYSVAELGRAEVTRLHHGLRRTPTQANRSIALLSKMMNLAERWGLRPDGTNPCRHVERYREAKRERFLSSAEIASLGDAVAALENERAITASVAGAVRLLLFTGARRGEILGLGWDHVDWERRCLRLPDSKTGAKTITLNAPAREVLSKLPRSSEWVFPTAAGASAVSLSRPWERIRKRARLPAVRIHDLRHTHASILAGAGFSLHVIGRVLGHTVPATTARYAHLADDPVREASESAGVHIEAALRGSESPAAKIVPLRRDGALAG